MSKNFYQSNDIYLNKNSNDSLDLKEQLNKANKTIEQLKLKIKELQDKLDNVNNSNNYNNIINNYQNIINQKDLEINNLKTQLSNVNNKIPSSKIYVDEMMSVNFISADQNIHYSVPCIKTNTFAEVEEKLYQKYPEYRETNNNFISNGGLILRFKTIDENHISNGVPITLVVPQ